MKIAGTYGHKKDHQRRHRKRCRVIVFYWEGKKRAEDAEIIDKINQGLLVQSGRTMGF